MYSLETVNRHPALGLAPIRSRISALARLSSGVTTAPEPRRSTLAAESDDKPPRGFHVLLEPRCWQCTIIRSLNTAVRAGARAHSPDQRPASCSGRRDSDLGRIFKASSLWGSASDRLKCL
ncbi:hypothetical protein PGTUg99_024548 [Puccinia graminis f. sp. tritici]|uniref:Uncharacterized protein n=1 Tax=Puccinia graminis f. sp. tritici TaxID=56615 RepID=A0A5B0Q1D2_PUCGR|nr:hypothetical protein PGTUg99_024548 [Puccinia graminis f. sp. tritici]